MILDTFVLAADGDFAEATITIQCALSHLQQAKARAEAAVAILERWATVEPLSVDQPHLQIGEVAAYLAVSVDKLRDWERNGLLMVPRAANGYRTYGPAEIERLTVIHALRQARYSTLSILRMFHKLETDDTLDLRTALDTPQPDDDIIYATDHWLSTLVEMIAAVRAMQVTLSEIETLH